MPRELITLQVGQCGNQIGCRFWDLALQEHGRHSSGGLFDESMSTFFRNVDLKSGQEIPARHGPQPISSLKARALLVDMEEGVLNEVLKGPLNEVFDMRHFLSDVSGSGNNWAHGHEVYGPQYEEELRDLIRRPVEECDSLQSFFLVHSLGGGTGSGLGTYVLRMLQDDYPDVYRFSTVVFPSADDDVVTSPYNCVLSMKELVEHADCVLPVENQALLDIVNKSKSTKLASVPGSSSAGGAGSQTEAKSKPFDAMNNIAAHMLLNLTSSMRFEGSLNIDLNEITMNLVPFPRLHFLIPSLSPMHTYADVSMPPRRLDQTFTDAFSRDTQLIKADPKRSKYLACGLLVRGDVEISDVNRNLARIKPELDMIHWNEEGFKIGLCSVPPSNHHHGLLCLANNCCIRDTFRDMHSRFSKLYRRKAHIFHYTEYMEESLMAEAEESLRDLISEYSILQDTEPPAKAAPRFRPV